MGTEQPEVIVLAGHNGSGKSTASRSILAEALRVSTFVNADVIAQGLCAFNPGSVAMEASRIMLEWLRELASKRVNFSFETTLAARSYSRLLDEWRNQGYRVRLYYFWVDHPDLAVARVAQRVRAGGHHVAEADIRQRYQRSVSNFFSLYRSQADLWEVYNNTIPGETRLIARGVRVDEEMVVDEATWIRFQEVAR